MERTFGIDPHITEKAVGFAEAAQTQYDRELKERAGKLIDEVTRKISLLLLWQAVHITMIRL